MKQKNLIKIGCFCIFSMLSACSDFLDVDPKDQISDATLWTSTANADLFLNNIYSGIPSPFRVEDPTENWSDNSMVGRVGPPSRSLMNLSQYTPANAPSQWGNFSNIRKANLFIQKVNASSLPDDWKKQRLGEARFLRAYYYTLLWLYYGGVPVITDVLNSSEQGDAIFRPRNTAEETFKFIVEECTAAAADLPLKAEAPRVTRGSALTLKGWVELVWASPIYNTGNDASRWQTAANTNKQVMDLGVYQLFPDYNALHLEDNNNNVEVIFDKQHLGGTSFGSSKETYWGTPWVDGIGRSWGGVTPTQEIIDEYVMANGLPITDPASGYDPQNPYVNREKRFYQSIVYDGSEWQGSIIVMKQGVGSRTATDLSDFNGATNTGYNLKKGMNPKYINSGNTGESSASFIIFRYAEVLLSFAEAQNEAAGPSQAVYDAVNQVRTRSELPPLKAGLDKDEMRKEIHRERRIELAFEEKRWFDLIRLRLAEKNLNATMHGMVIEQVDGKWVYRIIEAPGGTRVFDPSKNYFLPLPQEAVDRNPQLNQNPNY